MKVFGSFVAIAAILFSHFVLAQGTKPKTIHTPDESVTTTMKIVEPTAQKVVLVSTKELAAINLAASQATKFVADYMPGTTNPRLVDFDKAFHLWQKEKSRRYSESQITEMLGAYLGNQLATDLGMEWVIVTDEYGTDYAVRAKQKEVMSFPFSSVAKRIERNEHEFVVGVYQTVKQMLDYANVKSR